MLNTLFQHQDGPLIVKPHPNLGNMRFYLTLFIRVLIVSAIIYGVIYVITPRNPSTYDIYQFLSLGYQAFFITAAPLIVICIICTIVATPSLKEHAQRRRAAASGDQRFLALEQPISEADPLSLPYTIQPQLDWSNLLPLFAFTLLCLILLALTLGYFRPDSVFGVMRLISAGVLLIGIDGFFFWKFSAQKSKKLVVSEDGLTLLGSHTVHHLAWQDVRLLAIDAQTVILKKNRSTLAFEISGAQEVISWTWKRPGDGRAGSSASLQEYDRQMQAVLSLVAGRTGLPLYDLRRR